MRKKVKKILQKRIVILDGATGTQLQKKGMPQGVNPEKWALDNPKVITQIHRDYLLAGSDIVYTCTFGANRIKLKEHNLTEVVGINRKLVKLAKKAVDDKALVAGDISSTGKFVEPFGPLKFQEAVEIYKEQVKGLLLGGVDLFVIETMMDIQEARAAIIAVKELSDKFTMVTMTYEKNQRTLNGTDAISALVTLQSLGADAVGCNCSSGPNQMLEIIKKIKPYAKVPLVAKPNAGMPKFIDGETKFDMKAKEFSSAAKKLATAGANFLGGCCGTTPEHIKELKNQLQRIKPRFNKKEIPNGLTSPRGYIFFNKSRKPLIIGECINPTGKKSIQKELKEGSTALIRKLAREQEASGACLLDVNTGVPGIDEAAALKETVKLLSLSSKLPLVIDSSNIKAIEEALKIYPGRALINSISAEESKMKKLLPLAAKYGAMFILLPLKGKKIPQRFEERKRIILETYKEAKKFGFKKEDMIVDALVLAVSSNPEAAKQTLKTISWLSSTFGSKSVCGLSNISFGMPRRQLINSTFYNLAKKEGLCVVIANPTHNLKKYSKKAENLLLGKDKGAKEFLKFASSFKKEKKPKETSLSVQEKIHQTILEGNKEGIQAIIKEALKDKVEPQKLIDEIMIPAINEVGELFDKKQYFLPQLISSAEAMKEGFKALEPHLKNKNTKETKTIIILATVKGDIHDIGKNIVALMLQNHGFSVIDLGKDVSTQRIIQEIKKHKQPIVGLSALMTTTMVNMKEVIDLAKAQGLKARFIAGGAVITKSYAHSIGAEYVNDGVQAVKVVKKISK